MGNETRDTLYGMGVFLLLCLMSYGIYCAALHYEMKSSYEFKPLRDACPSGTEITDYRVHSRDNGTTFQIECDKKIMDHKVKVCEEWECKNEGKWGECKFREAVYMDCTESKQSTSEDSDGS